MFKKLGCTFAMTALLASNVNAAPFLTEFDFSLDAGWIGFAETGGDGPISLGSFVPELTGQFNGVDSLSWGVGASDPNLQSSIVVENPNILGSFSLADNGNGIWTDTQLGSLITHNNNTITGASSTLTETLLSDVFRLAPSGFDLTSISYFEAVKSTFDVTFTETLNSAPCGFESISVCDDIFVLINNSELSQQFDINGQLYTLSIGATNLLPLSEDTCTTAGVDSGCFGIVTQEGQANSAQFLLTLSTVPEPSILALLGLGLMGFGLRRRQKS